MRKRKRLEEMIVVAIAAAGVVAVCGVHRHDLSRNRCSVGRAKAQARTFSRVPEKFKIQSALPAIAIEDRALRVKEAGR